MDNTEQTNQPINKLALGVVVAFWICALAVILNLGFGIKDLWPAFLVLPLFFLGGGKPETIKTTILGSMTGLLISPALFWAVNYLTPYLGMASSVVICLFLVIMLLVALNGKLPLFFNDYAFVYMTVAGIYPKQATIEWLLATGLCGTVVILAIIGTLMLLQKLKNRA